jgi:hypothetical protein
MDLKQTREDSVDWIHLVYDRDKWWAAVNVVINPWVP